MFRNILKVLIINLIGVVFAINVLYGIVTYTGGWKTLILLAFLITISNYVIRPLINLVLLPFHLITLGLFRWLANIIALFLIIKFVPSIQVHSFTSPMIKYPFLIIPQINFSHFGAFLIVTIIFSLILNVIYWLFQD